MLTMVLHWVAPLLQIEEAVLLVHLLLKVQTALPGKQTVVLYL